MIYGCTFQNRTFGCTWRGRLSGLTLDLSIGFSLYDGESKVKKRHTVDWRYLNNFNCVVFYFCMKKKYFKWFELLAKKKINIIVAKHSAKP